MASISYTTYGPGSSNYVAGGNNTVITSSGAAQQVTINVNGTPVTVTETSPGLFGSLGYSYVSGGSSSPTSSPSSSSSSSGGSSGGGSSSPTSNQAAVSDTASKIQELKNQVNKLQSIVNAAQAAGIQPGQQIPQSIINSAGGGVVVTGNQAKIEELKNQVAKLQTQVTQAQNAGYTGNMQIEYDANGNIIPVNSKPIDMDWMINDPSFKALPSDMQEFLKTYYSTISTGSKENQERLLKALDIAQGQSNAYIGEIIRTTKSELERQIGIKTDDANSQIQELVTGINRIKQDLATGEGDLTVEEQAELKRLQRNYEIKLDSLRENVASAGLTFSSRRALAESRLEEEQADYIESTERKFARELRDLRLRASRGEEDAQTKIAEIERNRGIDVATLSRTAEQKVGTANLPSSAQGTIGGVAGEVVNKQWEDILARAKGLQSLTNF